jgi:hypothetical protein
MDNNFNNACNKTINSRIVKPKASSLSLGYCRLSIVCIGLAISSVVNAEKVQVKNIVSYKRHAMYA